MSRHPLIPVLIILLSLVSPAGEKLPFDFPKSESAASSLPLSGVNGPQATLVILVDFSDKPNSTTRSQIQSILQGLNDYYREDSYGLVSFQTSINPSTGSWHLMPQPMTFYGTDTSSSDSDLVHDALQSAYNSGTDLSNYKFSIVVHAGVDEAMPPHEISDIHSFTIPNYTFRPNLFTAITISTSVVSEKDPLGVFSHESGHLLGLPDLYDLTQQIDPANNFLGYWDLMALGEWNPNSGDPLQPSPGTYPSQHSAWSKIQLGFVSESNIVNVTSGKIENITISDLETQDSGVRAVRIPLAYNKDGTSTYYLLEMRAKVGTYDQYLPFAAGYPGAGLLVYKVNESIPNGMGSVRLVDAHPGGDISDAPFGPCSSPCVSNNTLWDRANFVKIIVTSATPSAYTVIVDRTSSPLVLLQVNSPSVGVLVSVDGTNATTDSSRQVRLPVRYGPHTLYIQPEIPISLGSTSFQMGVTNSFAAWGDGGTSNPRHMTLTEDTVITAIYRISLEPSWTLALVALLILSVVATVFVVHRKGKRDEPNFAPEPTTEDSPRFEGPPSFIPMG